MVRLILLCVATSFGVLISAGCPLEPPAQTPDLGDLTPQVSATVSAKAGESVTLTAELVNIEDPSGATFRWRQLGDQTIELQDPNTSSVSFVVPSVQAGETLQFRVDVTTPDGAIYTDTVEATAAAASELVIPAGWPLDPSAESTGSSDATPAVHVIVWPGVEHEVTMTAALADGTGAASVTYAWFQERGRLVEIEGAGTPQASFVAPSLPTDQTLYFRIDVQAPDGRIYSATVEVPIPADPDYGLEEGIDEDGEGDGVEKDPHPRVRLRTSLGTIVLELDRVNAPLTVNNFLRYVDDGFYDGTIFHRVIPEFMVQGGGFEPGLIEKETRDPIKNESDNGLENERGTVAMARLNDPDSATAQFFINLVDNESLDATSGANGYAVFGRVVQGMDVVDRMAEVETESRDTPSGGRSYNVPVDDIVLMNALWLSTE